MAYLLLSPLTWGLLLAIGLPMAWRRVGRAWRVVGGVSAMAMLVLCTPLGANALVYLVESQITSERECRAGDPGMLVLLPAGVSRIPSTDKDYAALAPESWRRLHGAIARWRKDGGNGVLLIAGGGHHAVKESALLANLARDWGVPAQALRTEARSTTTWESAFALRGMAPQHLRLASSALHLPRALRAFHAAGFESCAVVVDSDYLPVRGFGYFVPQSSAIRKTERAAHEIVGGIVYALRTRRSSH